MSAPELRKWLRRKDATAELKKIGVPVKRTTLETMASKGTGPQYRIINGQALYTREWLDEWLQQTGRPAERDQRTA